MATFTSYSDVAQKLPQAEMPRDTGKESIKEEAQEDAAALVQCGQFYIATD